MTGAAARPPPSLDPMAQRAVHRPPPWRDIRVLRAAGQIIFLVAVAWTAYVLWTNLVANLQRVGVSTRFDYLERPAGFRIAGSGFRSSQPVWDALLVGVKNTFLVSIVGIVLSTLLGIFVGVARLSSNWLVRRAASLYVESLRNIPVLVIIIFWSTAAILKLPRLRNATEVADVIVISNSGLWVPWFTGREGVGTYFLVLMAAGVAAAAVVWWRTRTFDRTGAPHHRVLWGLGTLAAVAAVGYAALGGPFAFTVPEREGLAVTGGIRLLAEYAALLLGLTVYTASHIAEIVRGSILAVPKGQTEAATAVGLTAFQRIRFVTLPQAFRIMIPPLANQYLNLTKNSSLGIAIGYAEIMAVTFIVVGNGNPAPHSFAIAMGFYLVFSLTISALTNLVNRRLQLAGGAR